MVLHNGPYMNERNGCVSKGNADEFQNILDNILSYGSIKKLFPINAKYVPAKAKIILDINNQRCQNKKVNNLKRFPVSKFDYFLC
jgi:hypothetical protein